MKAADNHLRQLDQAADRLKEALTRRIQDLSELSLPLRERLLEELEADMAQLFRTAQETRENLRQAVEKVRDENNVLRELLGLSQDGLKLKILQQAEEQKRLGEDSAHWEAESRRLQEQLLVQDTDRERLKMIIQERDQAHRTELDKAFLGWEEQRRLMEKQLRSLQTEADELRVKIVAESDSLTQERESQRKTNRDLESWKSKLESLSQKEEAQSAASREAAEKVRYLCEDILNHARSSIQALSDKKTRATVSGLTAVFQSEQSGIIKDLKTLDDVMAGLLPRSEEAKPWVSEQDLALPSELSHAAVKALAKKEALQKWGMLGGAVVLVLMVGWGVGRAWRPAPEKEARKMFAKPGYSITLPYKNPTGMAWDGTRFWISDWVEQAVFGHDLRPGLPVSSIHRFKSFNPLALVFVDNTLWTADTRRLFQHETNESLSVRRSFPMDVVGVAGLAWDGKKLYVADAQTQQLLAYSLDPKVRLENSWLLPGGEPAGLVWDGKNLWSGDATSGSLLRLDIQDDLKIAATIPLSSYQNTSEALASIAWDGQSLWSVSQSGKVFCHPKVLPKH